MKIKYKFLDGNEEKKLQFRWKIGNSKENITEISITGNSNNDLNELYDSIINNINEVEFVSENEGIKYSLALEASEIIIDVLKREIQIIKNKFQEITSIKNK